MNISHDIFTTRALLMARKKYNYDISTSNIDFQF